MTSEQLLASIYGILVKECGAPLESEQDFIRSIINGCQEYRCCPRLGFGGKFYVDHFEVQYYIEDTSPEKEEIKNKVNTKIKLLIDCLNRNLFSK